MKQRMPVLPARLPYRSQPAEEDQNIMSFSVDFCINASYNSTTKIKARAWLGGESMEQRILALMQKMTDEQKEQLVNYAQKLLEIQQRTEPEPDSRPIAG